MRLTHESVGDVGVFRGGGGDVQGDAAEVERRHDVQALEAAAHGAEHGRRVVDHEAAVAPVPGTQLQLTRQLGFRPSTYVGTVRTS